MNYQNKLFCNVLFQNKFDLRIQTTFEIGDSFIISLRPKYELRITIIHTYKGGNEYIRVSVTFVLLYIFL